MGAWGDDLLASRLRASGRPRAASRLCLRGQRVHGVQRYLARVRSSGRDPIHEAWRQWERHGWHGAADGMAMVTSLVRVHQLTMERIDGVLRPFELTFARYEVLQLLSFVRSGSMPMTRLGSLLQVHPTSITSVIDRLVRQGFVERLRSEEDGRVVLACLTESGRSVAARATVELNREVFERPGLPPDAVADLTSLLGRLRAGAGDEVEAQHLDPGAVDAL